MAAVGGVLPPPPAAGHGLQPPPCLRLPARAVRHHPPAPAAAAPPAERKPRKERAPKPEGASDAEPAEPRGEHQKNVVVRNLPRELDSAALAAVFTTHCGEAPTSARVVRGLGRVHFAGEEAATKALELTGTTVEGREIKVERELLRLKKAKAAPAADAAAAAGSADAAPAGDKPKKAKKKAAKPAAASGESSEAAAAAAAAAPAAEPAPPRRVRVDGLPEGTTPDNLKAAFASIGRVEAAKVIAGRGHGFVTFEDDATGACRRVRVP
jgi:RNA recognition motif-containing protein